MPYRSCIGDMPAKLEASKLCLRRHHVELRAEFRKHAFELEPTKITLRKVCATFDDPKRALFEFQLVQLTLVQQ